jgi:protein-S-isoprenylcysteine O-methyltransferase Ste14
VKSAVYYLALLILLGTPYIFVYWFLLHPFAHYWRRLGAAGAFLIIHSVMLLLIGVIFHCREPLLRNHFGVNVPLMNLAVLLFLVSLYIGVRRARYLTFPIIIGLPELSPDNLGKLLTEGVYSQIRHPRYVEGFFGLAAFALFTNYLAVYIVWVAYVPAIFLIVFLEERELRQRFGDPYAAYCRRVPRFVPRFRQGKNLEAKNQHDPDNRRSTVI